MGASVASRGFRKAPTRAGPRRQVLEHGQPLADEGFVASEPCSGDVGAWPRDALDQAERDRVLERNHDERDGLCDLVRCEDSCR
jgi:hypothetical protein